MRIGENLVARGVLTPEQLERALDEQRESGRLLGDVLLSLDFVSEEALARSLAEAAGIPYLDTDPQADSTLAGVVPEEFARQHGLAPYFIESHVLHIAQVNPFDVLAPDELQRMTGFVVRAACVSRSRAARLIDRLYGLRDEMALLVFAGMAQIARLDTTEVSPEDAPVVKLIDLMINRAVALNATDLHIEPEERVVRMRYRVDGVLIPGDSLPKELHPAIVSRIKVIAGLDIAEQRLPQDGRITHPVDGRTIDLRVSTFPTTYGEKVALRLLEKERLVRGLEDLGFTRKNLALFRDLLSKSRGIILVTGPTGAGKTTTLYSALSYLGGREKNILTVEDPVEYELPSIRQTQVKPKAGFTFGTAIRALLRQDPDVIMVGEIRDPETAQLALRAALSGILVFSTLHTQDSAGAVPRLMDMGLEPYLLASAVVGVIAQRLLRVICPACKEEAKYADEQLAKVGLAGGQSIRLYRGRGCAKCNGTGYRGRTGAFEILPVGRTLNDLIRQRADSRLIKEAAVRDGLKTLLDDALSKALFGVTTLEEVLRIAYE
jgi:type IV pilus assembly protein PilB